MGFGHGLFGFFPQVKLHDEVGHFIGHGHRVHNSDDGSLPKSLL